MDKSEEYIKMCEKAVEIQKLREFSQYHREKWIDGDFFVPKKKEWSKFGVVGGFDNNFYDSGCGCCSEVYYPETWLPRQDQLQDMLNPKGTQQYTALYLTQIFSKFIECETKNRDVQKSKYFGRILTTRARWSMEQLWLAFVMKEKYNKIWDGEAWIK